GSECGMSSVFLSVAGSFCRAISVYRFQTRNRTMNTKQRKSQDIKTKSNWATQNLFTQFLGKFGNAVSRLAGYETCVTVVTTHELTTANVSARLQLPYSQIERQQIKYVAAPEAIQELRVAKNVAHVFGQCGQPRMPS